MHLQAIKESLERIALALERLSPIAETPVDLNSQDAFVWSGEHVRLEPLASVPHVPLPMLHGIDLARAQLLRNTLRFARGESANNALLWGARGMGKSSLVKAVAHAVNDATPHALALVEVASEDMPTLGALLPLLAASPRRFILFCDDLSFEKNDAAYKPLKTLLEGGLKGRPANVLLYATSNRRHLMAREMIENEQSTALHPAEVIEEKLSLSDRFGLWLGFHPCPQSVYLAMIDDYAAARGLALPRAELHEAALAWAKTRGARSGRVAKQFIDGMTL